MTAPKVFTAAQRRRIVDVLLEQADPWSEARESRDRDELADRYVAGLPSVALARCPFTGALPRYSIDTFGLDGPWWDHRMPLRGDDDLPPTHLALTGALRLGEPVEYTPFLVRPGPEVPFVVPRLIEHPAVRAVVSHVRIGPHDGYPIAYFADPVPDDLLRFNTWGMRGWWSFDAGGQPTLQATYEDFEEVDFDLARWIAAGKLQWVAPGDGDLELRADVDGCPYVGLDGRRNFLRIQFGKVWEPELPTGEARPTADALGGP